MGSIIIQSTNKNINIFIFKNKLALSIGLCGLNQLWNLDKQIRTILHSQLHIKSNFATQKFSGQTCLSDSYRSQWRHGKTRVQIQFTMAVLPALNLSHVTGNAYCHHRGVLKGKSGSSDIQRKSKYYHTKLV